MPTLQFGLSVALVALLGLGVSAQAPTNKEKIVGVWEWQQQWGGTWRMVPRTGPTTIEFTRDGKIKTSDKAEGSYELDGNVLKAKLGEQTINWKIGRLDDIELVLKQGKLGIMDGTDKYSMRWFKKK